LAKATLASCTFYVLICSNLKFICQKKKKEKKEKMSKLKNLLGINLDLICEKEWRPFAHVAIDHQSQRLSSGKASKHRLLWVAVVNRNVDKRDVSIKKARFFKNIAILRVKIKLRQNRFTDDCSELQEPSISTSNTSTKEFASKLEIWAYLCW